jgi:DNA-binding response OmpR family regulator
MAKKIVIVDDDSVIVQGMKIAFELSGYEVECMVTGKRSKDQIIKSKPDVIFLDVMLDGIDGRDIAREIKADKRISQIPLIVISASHDIKDEVLECGADAFMPKPFSVAELIEKIEDFTPTQELTPEEIAQPIGIEK